MTTDYNPADMSWLPLMGNERRDMMRAAWFSAANREGDAERIRERLGYGAQDCRIDQDKTTHVRRTA